MTPPTYVRGDVVGGPDLFTEHEFRPYVLLSDDSHPFADEEGLFVAVTTTPRPAAISLRSTDFEVGGLPLDSYVNPWTIVSIRFADLHGREGHLDDRTVASIARASASYLGVS